MPSPLDTNLCRQLGNYVETLTHTGQKMLDKDILKKLKNICKYVFIVFAGHTVLIWLSYLEI
jgi:hypothetical protein